MSTSSQFIEDTIGQKLLLAFEGKEELSSQTLETIRQLRPSGFTLFRSLNIDTPAQVRRLTASLQEIARSLGLPPFLIAADQEGGQLTAIGEETTALPGNMALGAIDSVELSRKAGEVLGRELAAMGINVDYAPVCDISSNPNNPVIGIRSFGENAERVSALAQAMIDGIQAQGIAATAKHFPGHGDTDGDSHHGRTLVHHSLDRLRKVEFRPFESAIQSGVKLIMTAHIAVPAIDGDDAPPATLSPAILTSILREELKYDGIIVADSLEMRAIRQGEALGGEAVKAVNAGSDILILGTNTTDQLRVRQGLLRAWNEKRLDLAKISASAKRIALLKEQFPHEDSLPPLDVIGCKAHLAVAREIAERSITLVRDQNHLLPLRLKPSQRIAVVMPKPMDLTPADTSSYVKPKLSQAIRKMHPNSEGFVVSHNPSDKEIAGLLAALKAYDLILLGTLNATSQPGQVALARELLRSNMPVIIAALRLPYDLTAFPEAKTYLCTYSIQEPSLTALAQVLFGEKTAQGHLPVSIPGLYPAGYAMAVEESTG